MSRAEASLHLLVDCTELDDDWRRGGESNSRIKVLQTSPLPLGYRAGRLERETGFEPATSTLARSHSTTELFPLEIWKLNLPKNYRKRQGSVSSNGMLMLSFEPPDDGFIPPYGGVNAPLQQIANFRIRTARPALPGFRSAGSGRRSPAGSLPAGEPGPYRCRG